MFIVKVNIHSYLTSANINAKRFQQAIFREKTYERQSELDVSTQKEALEFFRLARALLIRGSGPQMARSTTMLQLELQILLPQLTLSRSQASSDVDTQPESPIHLPTEILLRILSFIETPYLSARQRRRVIEYAGDSSTLPPNPSTLFERHPKSNLPASWVTVAGAEGGSHGMGWGLIPMTVRQMRQRWLAEVGCRKYELDE